MSAPSASEPLQPPAERAAEPAPASWSREHALAMVVGATGLVCAALVLITGVDGTGAVMHQRAPYFDLNIFQRQAQQLDRPPFLISEYWVYPPFALVVLRPLAWLTAGAAHACWLVLQAALALALAAAVARVLSPLPRLPRYAAAFGFVVSSLPLWHGIGAGQVSLLLTTLAIAGLASTGRSGPLLLAAAAAFKIYPLFFTMPYAVNLRADYLRRFALWLLLLSLLVPVALLPYESLAPLWQRAWAIITNQWRPIFDEAQSVRALLERLFHSGSIFYAPPRPQWFALPYPALAALITLCNTAIVAISALRLRRLEPSSPLAIALALVAMTLLIDLGWPHYFVVLCYAQPVLLAHARGSGRLLVLCGLSFALSSGPLIVALLRPELVPRILQLSVITLSAGCALLGLWSAARREAAARNVHLK